MNLAALAGDVPVLLPYLPYVLAAFGVCAAIMPVLPVPAKADSAYGRVWAVINLLAHNYRNATNAKAPK
ncbi:hypothetical protein [Acidisphaera rubrifaciens]|uniref:Uncharacterized protein n=1 Tax=Acidisphaera rubrifaciens HS-AP3 TaxID=1231350 RepID=A0A0D6P310_9PROT|nr:hypothetical protein [Acidisphaera rubrifaciens]GAN76125.1 hypothetical protein Asru_0057_02 [Acidisphaera rubrifaciens HS-AP3]